MSISGCGIYWLRFPNWKGYVGQSKDLERRMQDYDKGKSSKFVGKAIKKYGWDNVKVEVLLHCAKESLDVYEIHFIASLKTADRRFGYNVTAGGDANPQSVADVRRRTSETHKQLCRDGLKPHLEKAGEVGLPRARQNSWSGSARAKREQTINARRAAKRPRTDEDVADAKRRKSEQQKEYYQVNGQHENVAAYRKKYNAEKRLDPNFSGFGNRDYEAAAAKRRATQDKKNAEKAKTMSPDEAAKFFAHIQKCRDYKAAKKAQKGV